MTPRGTDYGPSGKGVRVMGADRTGTGTSAVGQAGPRQSSRRFVEFRADGWPLCPVCGEDELYSLANPATVETITGCYRCGRIAALFAAAAKVPLAGADPHRNRIRRLI